LNLLASGKHDDGNIDALANVALIILHHAPHRLNTKARRDEFHDDPMIDVNQRVREMKLFSHIVKDDLGVAPNPFHGYCTTALCTPSHMNLRLKDGDWLIGTSPKKDGHKLVYAMRILDRLCMNLAS
jgi:hypothetical protein